MSVHPLQARFAQEIAAAADLAALDAVRVAALGKSGEVTAAAEVAGRDGRRHARRRGAEDPCAARGGHRRDRGARRRRWRMPSWSGGWRPSGSTCRCRRAERPQGLDPSGQPGDGRAHRDFRRPRLLGRRRAGDRGRLAQFHRAQHSRDPSGAGDARHLLCRPDGPDERADGAAHPHLAGADPDDAERRSRRSG